MPLSKVAFVRSTLLALLIGMVAILAIVGTTLWLVDATRTYSEELLLARRERAALVDLRGLLQEAETGQRGYLLNSSSEYVEPYVEAQRKIGPQLDRVRTLTSRDPAKKEVTDRLSGIISQKLSEMHETISLIDASRRDEAIALLRTNRGQQLMDQARDIFEDLVTAAETEVSRSVQRQEQSISALQWVTILGALIIVGVVGGAAWMVVAYTGQLVAAQREVEALNAGLEERVKERTAELGRANEEIQRFAYIVTHDLRAPLVNIMGFTSELEQGLEAIKGYMEHAGPAADDGAAKAAQNAAVEDLPEAIGFIRSSTRKMDGLINAVLKLSREGRRTLKPETIGLEALLQNSADSIQHQVGEAGGEISIKGTVPPIISDRLALEQIFGNLLDNAVKYRFPGRPLRIQIRARQEQRHRISVEVEDNGRGIAPQDHERVFDLFRRSGVPDQPGEGIGLAHVRTMVRNLGGDITLKSELEQGTVLRVTLPRDLRKITGVARSA